MKQIFNKAMIDRKEKKKNISLFFSASAVTFLFQDGGESTSRSTENQSEVLFCNKEAQHGIRAEERPQFQPLI